MLELHSNFIAKMECLEQFIAEWNHCFPGSLYIDFIGHIILDQRETSLGTAALYTNC